MDKKKSLKHPYNRETISVLELNETTKRVFKYAKRAPFPKSFTRGSSFKTQPNNEYEIIICEYQPFLEYQSYDKQKKNILLI